MFNFLRKLSRKEAKSLEDCLAKNGIEFPSQEEAEKYFFTQRDKDLAEVKQLNERFPQLQLDYRAMSLQRFEEFYFNVYKDNKIKLDISRDRMEELMTQYMRQVFVHLEMAEWRVFENEFAEGRYDIGLEYGYGSGTMENYARGLHYYEKEKNRKYLYDKFMMYVPEEREPEVQ
jgi:TPR repeat protein